MAGSSGLPAIRTIAWTEPFGWLADAWIDLWRAPGPCLVYGLSLAIVSVVLAWAIYASNAAFWVLTFTFGFVFVAPMLAMGLYEAARRLEAGEQVWLSQMLFVRSAFRRDTAYLGLALLLIYLLWGRIAQIVYGLSTWTLHRTIPDFLRFALETPEGHGMLLAGGVVGGVMAYFTFAMVSVAAPMLLDVRANVFTATITSFRAVAANPGPMTLWAAIIGALVLLAAATGFAGLVVIFPWLGLASWRCYRALVVEEAAGAGITGALGAS